MGKKQKGQMPERKVRSPLKEELCLLAYCLKLLSRFTTKSCAAKIISQHYLLKSESISKMLLYILYCV